MKFKKNQLVYFYQKTGEYKGTILSGVITSIIQDLEKDKVFYNIKVTNTYCDWDAWYIDHNFKLEKDQLYTSKKQIEKEYKDEIIYNTLYQKLSNVETILNNIFSEVKEKEVIKDNWRTLTITGEKTFSKLYVNAEDISIGNVSVKEEIEKLKKEIASIKKKLKPKTKKPVIKEKEDTQKSILDGGK